MDMFNDDNGKKLSVEQKETFHAMVAKALFASKRARPDCWKMCHNADFRASLKQTRVGVLISNDRFF